MYKDIDFEKAQEYITKEQVIVLDVRTEEEYITGHMANAILIPVDELESRLDELSCKSTKILVYCRSGRRSRMACDILTQNGYVNVYNIGGLVGWPYGLEK